MPAGRQDACAAGPAARARRLIRAAFAMIALLAMTLAGVSAHAQEYTLGPQDKLRVRVVEWQTAEAAVRDWTSISGDYVVGPSGDISLPFVGRLPASGRTTAELAAEISEKLRQKFALMDEPDASVEIAEFRPIFVSGDVETPGRYAFDPGLTVLKAVSLAGGIRRGSETGQRFERDFISARGNYEVLVSRRNGLLARRARLIAEGSGSEEIAWPEEVTSAPNADTLMADETAFKKARLNRLQVRLDAIDDLKELLTKEIESLQKKIVEQNRQIELATKELEGIGNLADRGLVVNSRVLSIERTAADLRSKVLDMETAMLRARQDFSEATQDAADLQSERETEIVQQRQQAEAEIDQVDRKMAMYRDLMGEALANSPEAAVSAGDEEAPMRYLLVRNEDGETVETEVDENASVHPGDVVKVDILPVPVQ
ncbi:polysaccharide biosynthesis/export family protein [Mesorhizobium xinjiangense]|uniref:polysaccharide biosynthesis/export family protein n=1 Tax=Mesorhizobium xinjiangense TaxID=2678685 RepID=UPI001F33DA85|nr:polysaccharide biosynthesis/export family protein [Mesorhizobium xinjiangense]